MTEKRVISPGIDTKNLDNLQGDKEKLPPATPNSDVANLESLRNKITGTYSWDRGE